jgi:F-type H+-transporting ATPase subunit epsilon
MPKNTLIDLKILLPFCVLTTEKAVLRMVVETQAGSMGILPHRMDFVAALIPGILVYEIQGKGEAYLALDEGIMIKTGFNVIVSVRNAVEGRDLETLQETVERDFMAQDEQEEKVREVMAKMESAFIHRIAAFSHE